MTQAVAQLFGGKLGWRASFWARRLTKDRTRAKIAAGIERAVASAERPPQPVSLSAAIPVERSSVAACHDELIELVERLRSPEPVYAQGVALAKDLLSTGDSPLYQADGDLEATVANILAALDGNLD